MSEVSVPDGVDESSPATNVAALTCYCRRCHRKLRNEESMKRGFGPICFQREAQDHAAEKDGDH
jgi:hypothetical protein